MVVFRCHCCACWASSAAWKVSGWRHTACCCNRPQVGVPCAFFLPHPFKQCIWLLLARPVLSGAQQSAFLKLRATSKRGDVRTAIESRIGILVCYPLLHEAKSSAPFPPLSAPLSCWPLSAFLSRLCRGGRGLIWYSTTSGGYYFRNCFHGPVITWLQPAAKSGGSWTTCPCLRGLARASAGCDRSCLNTRLGSVSFLYICCRTLLERSRTTSVLKITICSPSTSLKLVRAPPGWRVPKPSESLLPPRALQINFCARTLTSHENLLSEGCRLHALAMVPTCKVDQTWSPCYFSTSSVISFVSSGPRITPASRLIHRIYTCIRA